MTYKLSQEAAMDLEYIFLYTVENWSTEQGNRYIDLILDEIEYLCINPNSGFNYNHVRIGYLRIKVKSHFIFYKVNEKRNEIEVIRILHQVMDLENQLNP